MAIDLSQPKIIDPVKIATIGNTTGDTSVEKIDNIYMSRDKSGIISDFEIWKSKLVDVTDSSLNGSGSGRMGVKSYMNNYAFISFGSKDVGFGSSPKNEFVSGGDIGGLLADPDQWKVPTTKNIIEWSKKNKDEGKINKPFNVSGSKNQGSLGMGVATNSNDALKLGENTNQTNIENNQQFSSGGSIQGIGNFDYDWKDFVFCKNYGKIPNNRLLTLRRYKLPVLDNGTVGAKTELAKLVSNEWGGNASGQSNEEWATSDSARALTYFGEGTENSLNGLFGFTVGLNWTERKTPSENPKYNNNISTEGANFLSEPFDYTQLVGKINSLGGNGGFVNIGDVGENALTSAVARFSLKNRLKNAGLSESQLAEYLIANNLASDPFQNGWAYRIFGPVNVLLKTNSRARGLKFEGGAINLVFEYDMTQIGTMNPKLAMLDIISNMLSLTTNSGSFWGGDYRFKRDLTNVPIDDGLLTQIENMANGGSVDYNQFLNSIKSDFEGALEQIKEATGIKDFSELLNFGKVVSDGVDNVLKILTNQTSKDVDNVKLNNLTLELKEFKKQNSMNLIDPIIQNQIKEKEEDIQQLQKSINDKTTVGSASYDSQYDKNIDVASVLQSKDDVVRVILNNGILKRNGDVRSLAKNLMMIKPLITGEPVGEWHLTVGNPMQPIAMIGNLICTGMSMSFSEELGYDDFPTSIKFKVSLDHGRDRDKGDIESMFNMGQGRTYLNIKGATPWETGYSTRSSDNDNAKDPGEDNKNSDGTLGDSKTAQKNPPNSLNEDSKLDKTKGENDSLKNENVSSVDMKTFTNPLMSSGVKTNNPSLSLSQQKQRNSLFGDGQQ